MINKEHHIKRKQEISNTIGHPDTLKYCMFKSGFCESWGVLEETHTNTLCFLGLEINGAYKAIPDKENQERRNKRNKEALKGRMFDTQDTTSCEIDAPLFNTAREVVWEIGRAIINTPVCNKPLVVFVMDDDFVERAPVISDELLKNINNNNKETDSKEALLLAKEKAFDFKGVTYHSLLIINKRQKAFMDEGSLFESTKQAFGDLKFPGINKEFNKKTTLKYILN